MINLQPTRSNQSQALRPSGRSTWWRRNRKRLGKTVLIVCGVLVVVGGIAFLVYREPAADLMSRAQAGRDDFSAAQEAVKNEDFKQAGDRLVSAREHFTAADEALSKLGGLKAVPFISTQLGAVDNLLKAGIQTASALGKVATLADTIITPIKTDSQFTLASLTPAQKRVVLKQISEAYPDLVGIKAEIDLAALHIDQIPNHGMLPQLKKAVDPIKEQLPTLREAISNALPMAEIIPPIAGYPEPQTYLFLLQNNTELRPTGGFIGTYGILKIADAEITSFRTDNIYNLDNPVKDTLVVKPPTPLQKYLKADKWFMRDSNWSPDFPTAAEQALWFYQQENGPEKNIDGVIAMTPNLIESLLKLTGSITVDGIEFTSENFTERLQYQVEQGFYRQGISDADRKEIIGVMADELMNRVLNFPQERWGELWQVIINHIEEKQILLYSNNENLETLIAQENWGGSINQDANSDFLMVIDANMASLKSDPGVFRSIQYSVEQTKDGAIADVTINYNNTGSFNWKSTRYRTYTRVYVPEGSQLLEHSGVMENDRLSGGRAADPDVYNELGKTVIAGFISIEPQESGTLHYRYALPANIVETMNGDQYSLLIQKQPGTKAHNLEVSLKFQRDILNAEPIDKIESTSHTSVALKSDLLTDRALQVTFR